MTKSRLLATVTASLLLGVGAASAQSMNAQQPERAPAAQQNAPAEKVAPSMKAGERKGPETTGQSTHENSSGTAGGHAMPDTKSNNEMKSNSERRPGTTGQAPGNASPDTQRNGASNNEKNSNGTMRSDEKGGAGMNRSEERSGSHMNKSETENSRSTTTGQGAAAGSAKLTTEQRTKITTVIKQHKVQPTHLNVSVRVGTRIPASVHFYPLPTEVVEVYPEWRGFDYIMVGDQILVVEPDTHEIVAILDA